LIDIFVLDATFSNISAISWKPVLAGVPAENHRSWAGECTLIVIYKAGREPTPYW
jgi:hypothetical protein